MLIKLLKYDTKNIVKYLWVFYSLSVLFGILTRIFTNIENSFIFDIIGKICQGTAISMIFNIVINSVMRLWVRFKNNLYGDESYLTHTLPVERKMVYNSKIIAAVITLFISIAVAVLTLFAAYYSKDTLKLVKLLLSTFAGTFDSSITMFLLLFFFVLFLEFLNILQCGYTGIIIGHKMRSAKTGLSVLFGFVAYSISQVIVTVVIFIVALFNKDFMNLFITNTTPDVSVIKFATYISLASYTVVFFIGWFVNIKLLKKGVNVD